MRLVWLLVCFGLLGGCCPNRQTDSGGDAAEAIQNLNALGHRVYNGSGAGESGVVGVVCFLVEDNMGAEEARLVSRIENLVEIRAIPNGGPEDAFWDHLESIDSLRDFAVHYGLNRRGVRCSKSFCMTTSCCRKISKLLDRLKH